MESAHVLFQVCIQRTALKKLTALSTSFYFFPVVFSDFENQAKVL